MRSISKRHALTSGASWIACADALTQEGFLDDLDEGELLALPFLFEFWAMNHQLPPEGAWRTWVVLGGRGAGKTRAGAEWVRHMVEGPRPLDPGKARRVALVGETIEQTREVMVFGDSGILACSPEDRRPTWNAGRKRLIWPNGAEASIHTAYDPEGLRGPQFDAAWVDEFGCAAVDKGTNEPNKFLDPKSAESSLPKYSTGAQDALIQAQYISAVTSYWADPAHNPASPVYDGPMLDMSRAFVWAWDTRPYPFFPNDLSRWRDGENYARGHWINGRTSSRTLASVVSEICERAGVAPVDTTQLYGMVRGYTVAQVTEARTALQPLMIRYGFDAIERDGCLCFRMRDAQQPVVLDPERLAITTELEGTVEQVRDPEVEVSGRVRVRFVEAEGSFDVIAEEAVLADAATHAVTGSELNMALSRGEGRAVAEHWLTEARVSRESLRLALPPSQSALGAGDIIELPADGQERPGRYRIDRVEQAAFNLIDAVRVESAAYIPVDFQTQETPRLKPFTPPLPVQGYFLDLPLLRGDETPHAPHVAATATPWPGTVGVYSSVSDSNYALNTLITARSIVGHSLTAMGCASAGIIDHGPALQVRLASGALESVEDAALFAGANLAAIGDGSPGNWEVFQFGSAELIAPDTYALGRRLRGQAGTDGVMPDAWPEGSVFVLLNGRAPQLSLSPNLRQVLQYYRIGPGSRDVADSSYRTTPAAFDGVGLRPLSPVHLRAQRAGDGSVDLSWTRRARQDADGWNSGDIPLGEETESYLIRVQQGNAVARELSVSQPHWTYDMTMQGQDGVAGAFEVAVAQLSAVFGPGPFQTVAVSG